MYYTPKDKGSDIKMIKVVAKITVRPSGSKVTSNAEFDNVKFQGEDEFTDHHNHNYDIENNLDLNNKDPESLAIWNHPIYKLNVEKNIIVKDH